ncbi:hypothetical protein D3C75_821090 [compost metagenome]
MLLFRKVYVKVTSSRGVKTAGVYDKDTTSKSSVVGAGVGVEAGVGVGLAASPDSQYTISIFGYL